jgi:putative ABC transport system permease protein
VTLAASVPGPRGWRFLGAIETPGHPRSPQDVQGAFAAYTVAPDYFAFMRMPLVAGRPFDEGSAARHEVIVSETFAREIWPDGQAVGRQLRNATPRSRGVEEPWQTVVGVVPDVVTSLVMPPNDPGFYRPLALADTAGPVSEATTVVVRLAADGVAARLPRLADELRPAGAEVTIANVRDAIDESLAEPRFTMRVLTAFAALGVLLAAIGLFGVISYSVGQRTREIGVRMTLGATRRSIARLVVGDGIRLALLGIALGLAGAAAATRLIQSLLYGVPRLDPFAFGAGALLLLLVAIVACVVPMLRATAVDPAIAVRAE